ncbi:Acetylglucosaminyltransferase, partial [Globisporangium splendens]
MAQRQVWFQLVDLRGEAMSSAAYVESTADATVADLLDAVTKRDADLRFVGIAARSLCVYENSAVLLNNDETIQHLDDIALLGTRGAQEAARGCEWKQTEDDGPIYDLERDRLHFIDRDYVAEQLQKLHWINYNWTNYVSRGSGRLCMILLGDHASGLGKSAFADEHIRQWREIWLNVDTRSAFETVLCDACTVRIVFDRGELLAESFDNVIVRRLRQHLANVFNTLVPRFSEQRIFSFLKGHAKERSVDAQQTSRSIHNNSRTALMQVRHRISFSPLLLLLLFVAWTTPAIAAGSGYGFLSPEQLHLTLRELYQHGDKSYLYKSRMLQAAAALEVAVLRKGATDELHSLFKARNWMANWQDREVMIDQVERFVEKDLRTGKQTGVNGLDFAELPLPSVLTLNQQAYRVHASSATRRLCCTSDDDWRLETPTLRIGFVSSDFGVHPVPALMRGMLALLSGPDHPDVTVYCYSLTAASSWWRRNISRHVDHMVSLVGKNAVESAAIIRVHILIDLNGHTLHSGLSIFQYRLCPVQWSFLGYPMITGSNAANGIDPLVSDAVATPVESSTRQFTEKLLLLPTHYIVNDHLQMLGHTLEGPRPKLRGDNVNRFVFATFSNWQKMDPSVFSAWMAIFTRVPSSVLWFLRYSGHEDAEVNLKREADAHGIDGATRLIFSPLAPWVNHTHGKRAADLVLDTTLKSGHTTLLDVLCAGVPVLTLEGNRMSNRAGASALHALGLQHALTVSSLKEYVDVAVFLATHPRVLSKLRTQVEERRVAYPLLDTSKYTRNFVHALKSSCCAWRTSPRRGRADAARVVARAQTRRRALRVRAGPARTRIQDQYMVMKMMFGAQLDAYDVHKVGFFAPLLVDFLERAGFCEIERVDNFGLFNDTSAMVFRGTPISLNVQARVCDKNDGA